VPISAKEIEGMFEGWRAALDAIVHPASAVEVFIETDGGRLATDDGHTLDYGNLEFVWMLGESCCAGLRGLLALVMRRME